MLIFKKIRADLLFVEIAAAPPAKLIFGGKTSVPFAPPSPATVEPYMSIELLYHLVRYKRDSLTLYILKLK